MHFFLGIFGWTKYAKFTVKSCDSLYCFIIIECDNVWPEGAAQVQRCGGLLEPPTVARHHERVALVLPGETRPEGLQRAGSVGVSDVA